MLTALLMLFVVALQKPSGPPQAGNTAFPDDRTELRACEVTVVDRETNKPLNGCVIQYYYDFTEREISTDPEGRATIPLAGPRFRSPTLSLDVWDETHVQQRFQFSPRGKDGPIPAKLTVSLLPGTASYGGIVQDEAGQPIAGATVRIWGYLGEKVDPRELLYMVRVKTNHDGRWVARGLRPMKFINLYLQHPDYQSDGIFTDRHFEPPSAALAKQTDVQVMTRGIPLEGLVHDAAGQPIEGATVLVVPNGQVLRDNDLPSTTSGPDGWFRFPHLKPGTCGVVVTAPGRGPAAADLDLQPTLAPPDFLLKPGRVLTGRVVDTAGKPIAGAFVNIDTWKTYRCLGAFLATDTDGRFRWTEAPEDDSRLLLNASAPGYLAVRGRMVRVGENDVEFTLRPCLTIRGVVRDAATKTVIPRARIDEGTINPTNQAIVWRNAEVVGRSTMVFNGTLTAELDASLAPRMRIRVVAPGYKPAVSPEFAADAVEVEWSPLLEPDR